MRIYRSEMTWSMAENENTVGSGMECESLNIDVS